MALDTRYDTRLLERNIKKGFVTREEIAERLETLPDLSDKAEAVEIPQPDVLAAEQAKIEAEQAKTKADASPAPKAETKKKTKKKVKKKVVKKKVKKKTTKKKTKKK